MTAMFLIVLFAMAAFAVEIGTMMFARAKMQSAADAAALAGVSVLSQGEAEARAMAKQYAAYHDYFGDPVILKDEDIKIGFFNPETREFSEDSNGNAVSIRSKIDKVGLVFASLIGTKSFSPEANAIATAPARDIVFVVDLSGSMNDDTEPVWATKTVNDVFASTEFAGVGDNLVRDLYSDLGFGTYPGAINHIGYSLGVSEDSYAYHNMTVDNGPLSSPTIASKYRIASGDSERTRREKCYSWIIDKEIAATMPNALPTPDSDSNFGYWEVYIDYIIKTAYVHSEPWDSGGGGGGDDDDDPGPQPPQPPAIGSRLPSGSFQSSPFQFTAYRGPVVEDTPVDRGWIPSNMKSHRIYGFNNPNTYSFPDGDSDTRWQVRNKIGYLSYVQFMLDFGREDKPDGKTYVPISLRSDDCPMHLESTDGGEFWFPPRTQPMHSCRRALISAINVVKTRNQLLSLEQPRDRVSIVTFDKLSSGARIVQPLTDDYNAAMVVCTELQASIDQGRTTATEVGLKRAKDYIKPKRTGGFGRNNVNKVVVMLTDGLPNDFESDEEDISTYLTDNSNSNFYGGGYNWLDAPLMQTRIMSRKGWQVYPVGVGFGTDYEFMDRLARMGGTAISGQSLRGSGNPALYEQRLRELFHDIIQDPQVNLSK